MGYANVVVGTDGSATAGLAVDHAATMAAAAGARMIIVTAYQPDEVAQAERTEAVTDDIAWSLTDGAEADRIARAARESAHERGVEKVVVRAERGGPTDALLDAAAEFDADLIVVGSVGMTSNARFLLGSVANDVTHHAPCDVLVIRTEG